MGRRAAGAGLAVQKEAAGFRDASRIITQDGEQEKGIPRRGRSLWRVLWTMALFHVGFMTTP